MALWSPLLIYAGILRLQMCIISSGDPKTLEFLVGLHSQDLKSCLPDTPPYFWKQGLSLNLEFPDPVST